MVLRTPKAGHNDVPNSKVCLNCGRRMEAAFPGDIIVCPHCGATWLVARDKVWVEREVDALLRVPTEELDQRASEIANGEFHPLDGLRPEVAWFALYMEEKLKFNDMKGELKDLEGEDVAVMFSRAHEELGEAFREILAYCSSCGCTGAKGKPEAAIRELADAANFLMMTAVALYRRSNPFRTVEEDYRDLTQKTRFTNALRAYAESGGERRESDSSENK